jgi:hypothetical protein
MLINRIERVTLHLDTFTTFMTTEQPYQQMNFHIAKGIGKLWNVEAGYVGRRLDHSRDYGAFNREFSRFYLTGTLLDYPPQFSFSLSGEAWIADGGNTFYGVDFEAKYQNKIWKASTGVDYSLYKYNYYYQKEKSDIYTLFARFEYKLSHFLKAKAKYEFEWGESEQSHLLEIEAKIIF